MENANLKALNPKILAAARRLRQTIPAPAPPKRKLQKSFASLAAGQRLQLTEPLVVGDLQLSVDMVFEVTEPSNLGVTLVEVNGSTKVELADREWKTRGLWKRIRRPSKRKAQ